METTLCAVVFRSKHHNRDSHDEINGEHFLDSFEVKILENVSERSFIVLDNASYHNVVLEKVPTKSSTKTVMQEWLTSKKLHLRT